jgi:hypothetical protein
VASGFRIGGPERSEVVGGLTLDRATPDRRAPRLRIYNVSLGVYIEAQFNPTEFERSLQVNYGRQTVPGLSHQPLQYINTGNQQIPLELYFDITEGLDVATTQEASRDFLEALCYPRQAPGSIKSAAPPRALIVWPNVLSLECVVTALTFKYLRFNLAGQCVQWTAKLTLEEILDRRITSEDVLTKGAFRTARQGGG